MRPLATDEQRGSGFIGQQRLTYSTLSNNSLVVQGSRLGVPYWDAQLAVGIDCATPLVTLRATRVAAEAVTFAPPSGLGPSVNGSYAVCACDPTRQSPGAPHRESWNLSYVGSGACATGFAALDVAPLGLASDLCEARFPACLGTACDAAALPGALCLSHADCRLACNAAEACVGFLARDAGTSCVLLESLCWENATRLQPGHTQYRKRDGATCSEAFARIGALTVTQHAHVGLTYLLPPATPASIEVTGAGLSDVAGVTLNRVMIIDEGAKCGVDEASALVAAPAQLARVPPLRRTLSPDDPEELTWNAVPGYFCPGRNMDVLSVAFAEHQCYAKCSRACRRDDCFCDGYFGGYDTNASRALCADLALCKQIASRAFATAVSIDMHNARPRCFINVNGGNGDRATCGLRADANPATWTDLVVGSDYTLYVPSMSVTPETVVNAGGSSPSLLRFAPVQLRTTGAFKLCFCDRELGPCDATRAFGVELGLVHASGVECLVGSSASCAQQPGGGLRCYEGPPPLAGRAASADPARNATAELADFCRFAPPEEAGVDPRCFPVAKPEAEVDPLAWQKR